MQKWKIRRWIKWGPRLSGFLSCVSKTEAGGGGMGVDRLLRREHMGSLAKGFPWVLSAKKGGKSGEVLSMRCIMTVHRYRSRFINAWHYWHLVLDDSLLWGHPVHCRRLSSIPGLCSLMPVTTKDPSKRYQTSLKGQNHPPLPPPQMENYWSRGTMKLIVMSELG